ncbi:nuclear transport factor 2 family protein [Pontimicrobium aquaticum]|uniref:Nuclear transport factor 2 family protein n=1 Tax=Pontimicrobium aquaticum TaxID=2565367 RepID=A0A4U0EXL6_9FLAO|nr:nuclear transport factor 2 family protein [Pontimicrobium aquaticum]
MDDLVSIEKNGLEEIKETLSNYIDGTANGEPQKLKRAFHQDFNLYYIKNGDLSVLSGKQYIGNFKEGKKNNRIGNILSLDYENNAGLAKVQVIMPDRNRIAIDYLLLLKIKDEWKIIHKSFTSKSY